MASTLTERRPGPSRAPVASLSLPRWRVLSVAAAKWTAIAFALSLCSWQSLDLQPQSGLDPGWSAALHMAVHAPMVFGRDVIFTFGPLGFLSAPTLWYVGSGTAAFFYQLLLRMLLAGALFAAARRNYGNAAGLLIAFLIATASNVVFEAVPFFIFLVWLVDRVRQPRSVALLLAFAGAVAGLEMLGKVSTGITLVVLTVLAALGARGSRLINVGGALAATLIAFVVFWLLCGQPVGGIPSYLHGAGRIVAGYAGAMGIEEAGLSWENLIAWVPYALGVLAALQMTSGGSARRRGGILALWTAFCFFQFKEGFVRHDAGHAAIYFVTLMGAFVAFQARRSGRLVALASLGVLLVLSLAARYFPSPTSFNPIENARLAVDQIKSVVGEPSTILAEGRARVQAQLPLDPTALALLRNHTVHVSPNQTALVWAYRLDWDPLPVFQSYSAYTVGLDQQNADKLTSASAPERIVRNLEPGIDGRIQSFDEPAATRAVLCRYRQLYANSVWQVLGRAPDRCGAPAPLQTVRAGWDQPVPVPAPPDSRSFVFVRIDGAAPAGPERLGALLYKPQERFVVLDGGAHRLVEGAASDGLLLRAAPGVDYPAPFGLAPNSSTIAVGKAGQAPSTTPILTFSFFVQDVTAGPN